MACRAAKLPRVGLPPESEVFKQCESCRRKVRGLSLKRGLWEKSWLCSSQQELCRPTDKIRESRCRVSSQLWVLGLTLCNRIQQTQVPFLAAQPCECKLSSFSTLCLSFPIFSKLFSTRWKEKFEKSCQGRCYMTAEHYY